MCNQRSNVNANIVKAVAIVVASKTKVFITQIALPNVHGYAPLINEFISGGNPEKFKKYLFRNHTAYD